MPASALPDRGHRVSTACLPVMLILTRQGCVASALERPSRPLPGLRYRRHELEQDALVRINRRVPRPLTDLARTRS